MLNLTDETFKAELAKPGVLVVDFWAVWCPPCRAMSPVLDKVAAAFPNVTFAKVNAPENSELSTEYQIQTIPAFLIFKDGKLVHRWSGSCSAEQFGQILKDHGVTG
jgi:thioredoxin 1